MGKKNYVKKWYQNAWNSIAHNFVFIFWKVRQIRTVPNKTKCSTWDTCSTWDIFAQRETLAQRETYLLNVRHLLNVRQMSLNVWDTCSTWDICSTWDNLLPLSKLSPVEQIVSRWDSIFCLNVRQIVSTWDFLSQRETICLTLRLYFLQCMYGFAIIWLAEN